MGVDPTVSLHNSVLNVKAVVAAFNQEKALVGAFSVITNLRMELFQALEHREQVEHSQHRAVPVPWVVFRPGLATAAVARTEM